MSIMKSDVSNSIAEEEKISILSFNVKFFRVPENYSQFSLEMIDWVVEQKSDIKCIQEFSTNSNWPVLDTKHLIENPGYQSFTYSAEIKGSDHNLGMAIFSKYKVHNSGFVWKKKGTTNAGMFIDIVPKEDTIRIYNVHLSSMGIEPDHLRPSLNSVLELLKRLKLGALEREVQVAKLLEHIAYCPHRFIICGDFNEPPFGYNYRQLKKNIPNTFEAIGEGFGRTYNDWRLPLRIDHEFHHQKVKPIDFYVDQRMNLSDHFPIIGNYKLSKPVD